MMIKFLHIFFGLALIVLVSSLVLSDINPSGTRIIQHSPAKPSSLVSGPEPNDRIIGVYGQGSDTYWEMNIDPVYFDLYIPRLYQRLTMEVVYQSERQPLVELGGLGSSTGWQITLKPAQNSWLDELDWLCQSFIKVRICQSSDNGAPHYNDFQEFLQSVKDRTVVTYHYDFAPDVSINAVPWQEGLVMTDYNYLVTTYFPPQQVAPGWYRTAAVFSPDELWLAGHVYKFVISTPGLDTRNGRLRIKSIKFILEKDPITAENYKQKLKNLIDRNLNKLGL